MHLGSWRVFQTGRSAGDLPYEAGLPHLHKKVLPRKLETNGHMHRELTGARSQLTKPPEKITYILEGGGHYQKVIPRTLETNGTKPPCAIEMHRRPYGTDQTIALENREG